jgi:undecaprenyl-diphosphatase
MNSTKEWNCLGATWLVLFLGLAVRLALSSHYLLTPDEANYWQWSRYLDIGYYDHPPMIAWTIHLAARLFGQTEFAVRLPTILGITVASSYMCLLAARWFSCRCAFHVALVTQAILLFNGSALVATPDGLLLPCWAAACYHAAQALERNRAGQWLLTGIWFGLGLLSKYTMLLFLPSLFFCMLAVRGYRPALLTWKPWFGLVVGFLVFTPVVVWNAQHDWVTFRHVLFQGGVDNKALLTLRYIGDFFGTQAALLSPVLFCFILAAWMGGKPGKRLRPGDGAYLTWMSLTGFTVFTLLAFHVRIYGNWPGPVYVTAIILACALFSPGQEGRRSKHHRLWNLGVALAFFMSAAVMVQLVYPVLPVRVDLDRTARETKGWKELARVVDGVVQEMDRPGHIFVFGLRYQFASELAFYMPGQPRTVSINRWTRPNVYDFWFKDSDLLGMDAVGIIEDKNVAVLLRQVFDRVDPPEEIPIYRTSPWFGRELVNTFYLVRCHGFRGGLRWQPTTLHDIRAVDSDA